ncbi:MAG: DEAD/DEAH box helicase [Candidatus Eremiobacteraeota bacterium]|nr:DEAD/DEAH box helicase [Candidatus Eremiobacteraeota bacterium]
MAYLALMFTNLGLVPPLLRAVADLKFTEPTPVQAAAIPPALAGRDVLASAQTGSGKTGAFGLPLLQALIALPRGKTRALILAPTRELAAQITEHLSALAKYTPVKIGSVYGGVGFGGQAGALRRGTDIIVATPGRLLDHIAQGTAKLNTIEYLVLDEADRMLDMGFLPVVRRIIKMIPPSRQTLSFSATIPPAIAALTKEMLRDPVRVNLQPKTAPAVNITQTIYTIDQQRKTDLLVELLKDNNIFSAIAFTRTKARANRLAAALEKQNISAERIHGDRSQAQRTRALEDFKRGKYRILVATDIASRGIDIVDLGHVVNYDVPMVPEDYVHRIGRTARAKASGDAITFVSPDEETFFAQIERTLGKRLDRSKNPDLPAPAAPAPRIQVHNRRQSGNATRRKR